jgi:hypothetical protein
MAATEEITAAVRSSMQAALIYVNAVVQPI